MQKKKLQRKDKPLQIKENENKLLTPMFIYKPNSLTLNLTYKKQHN
jgi:hypothetical protein